MLLCLAAQQLEPQGDVLRPARGVDPQVAREQRGVQSVHHGGGGVLIALKNLREDQSVGSLRARKMPPARPHPPAMGPADLPPKATTKHSRVSQAPRSPGRPPGRAWDSACARGPWLVIPPLHCSPEPSAPSPQTLQQPRRPPCKRPSWRLLGSPCSLAALSPLPDGTPCGHPRMSLPGQQRP